MRQTKNRERSDRRRKGRQWENEEGFVEEGERLGAEADRWREGRR